jgi:hypothetical protein
MTILAAGPMLATYRRGGKAISSATARTFRPLRVGRGVGMIAILHNDNCGCRSRSQNVWRHDLYRRGTPWWALLLAAGQETNITPAMRADVTNRLWSFEDLMAGGRDSESAR